jgi:hypothetical protein
MGYAVFFAIGLGYATGALFGYRIGKFVAYSLRRYSRFPWFVTALAAGGSVAMACLGAAAAFFIGGNIGGGLGGFVSDHLGLGTLGVPVGMAFLIALIFGTAIVVGALVGGF